MLIVTSYGVPGHRIDAVLGTVVGTSIRRQDLGGTLRGMGGGVDHEEFARAAKGARHEAILDAWRDCQDRGANAVVGLKFDTSEVAGAVEVCAYGTAVVVQPLADGEPGATPQSAAIAARPPAQPQWPTMEGGPKFPLHDVAPAPIEHAPAAPAAQPTTTPATAMQPLASPGEMSAPAMPQGGHDQPEDPRWAPTADTPLPADQGESEEPRPRRRWGLGL